MRLLKNINYTKIQPSVLKKLKTEKAFIFQLFNIDHIINETYR